MASASSWCENLIPRKQKRNFDPLRTSPRRTSSSRRRSSFLEHSPFTPSISRKNTAAWTFHRPQSTMPPLRFILVFFDRKHEFNIPSLSSHAIKKMTDTSTYLLTTSTSGHRHRSRGGGKERRRGPTEASSFPYMAVVPYPPNFPPPCPVPPMDKLPLSLAHLSRLPSWMELTLLASILLPTFFGRDPLARLPLLLLLRQRLFRTHRHAQYDAFLPLLIVLPYPEFFAAA